MSDGGTVCRRRPLLHALLAVVLLVLLSIADSAVIVADGRAVRVSSARNEDKKHYLGDGGAILDTGAGFRDRKTGQLAQVVKQDDPSAGPRLRASSQLDTPDSSSDGHLKYSLRDSDGQVVLSAPISSANVTPPQDPAKRPRHHSPVPGQRDLFAYVLPKPFNWAIFESVSIREVSKDKKGNKTDDQDLAIGFVTLRGRTIGRKEAPAFLSSWYHKEKDFPEPPSKRPGVPPTIGLPSGEGLGLPTSSITLILTAIVEYEDRNNDRRFNSADKVIKRVELTEMEWDRLQKGSIPETTLPFDGDPDDSDDPVDPEDDLAAPSEPPILTLSSTSLSKSPNLRFRAWSPRVPIATSSGQLILHPRSTLLRIAVKDVSYKSPKSRLAIEAFVVVSRRGENRTQITGFYGKQGGLLTNGGGTEGANVAWLAYPSHAHSISEGAVGVNDTHASVDLFADIGEPLEKKEMEQLMAKVPKVVSKSLGQYGGVEARRVVWSFGGEERPESAFWNVTVGQGTDAVPQPLSLLLPSQQHGPAFTHTLLWAVGSIFLFAGLGMAVGSAIVGVERSRSQRGGM